MHFGYCHRSAPGSWSEILLGLSAGSAFYVEKKTQRDEDSSIKQSESEESPLNFVLPFDCIVEH